METFEKKSSRKCFRPNAAEEIGAQKKELLRMLKEQKSTALLAEFKELAEKWETLFKKLHSNYKTLKSKNRVFYQEEKKKSQSQKKKSDFVKQKLNDKNENQLKENRFNNSLKTIKQIWDDNIKELELSLNEQKQARYRMSANHKLQIQLIDEELGEPIQTPSSSKQQFHNLLKKDWACMPLQIPSPPSLNSSLAFEQMMQDLPYDDPDISRISLEKDQGRWMSDLESEEESQVDVQEVKDAMQVLSEANLLEGELADLAQDQDGNLELLMQLLQFDSDGRKTPNTRSLHKSIKENTLEFTTPMSSLFGSNLQSNEDEKPEDFESEVKCEDPQKTDQLKEFVSPKSNYSSTSPDSIPKA